MATAIVRLPTVKGRTGLSRSTIYLRVSQGTFPAPVSLGGRAVGWIESEVDAWIAARAADRDGRKPEQTRRAATRRRLALPTAVPILNGEGG